MEVEEKHVCMLPRVPACSNVPPTAGGLAYRLCRLRSLLLPCAWHCGTQRYARSTKRLAAERERVHGATVHPHSAACFAAHAVHSTLTLAVLLYMPFQVFMHCPNPYDPFILLSDALSLLNVACSFATGYVDDGSKLVVLAPRRIARQYLRTRFLPDLVGALPLQVIHLYDDCSFPSHTVMLSLKLFRLPTFGAQQRDLLEQLGLSYVAKRIVTVVIRVLLFFHWMTYVNYQVPCFTVHFFPDDEKHKVWLKRFSMLDVGQDSMFQKYTANLFLVCGLCVGAGYHSPVEEHVLSEMALTAAEGLAGVAFLVYAFSALLQLTIYRQYAMNLFNGRARELQQYMGFKRLPEGLQRKVQLFLDYKFHGHYFNEDVIMATINEQIRQDINMYGCQRMLMAVPLLQDMPIALINALIFNLTQVLFMPGELLVKCGEPGYSLYMISSGTVAVMTATGQEIAHLRDGAYFGESALLRPGKARVATVIALEITEIYRLDSKEFQECVKPYPHLRRRLAEARPRRRGASARTP